MQATKPIFFEDGYISLFVFVRYYVRMVFASVFFYINIGWALAFWNADIDLSPAQALRHVDIAMLGWLLLSVAFSIWVWRFKAIFKPVFWRNGTKVTIRVAEVQADGSAADVTKTQRMWRCWWAFNWRYLVTSILPFLLMSAWGQSPESTLILDFAFSLWTGFLAMWWWIFHPYGKTHVLLTREIADG